MWTRVRKDEPELQHHGWQVSQWKALTDSLQAPPNEGSLGSWGSRGPTAGRRHHPPRPERVFTIFQWVLHKGPHTASETKELRSYSTCKMTNMLIPFTSIKTMIRKKMAGRRIWGKERAGKKGFGVQRILCFQLYEIPEKMCCPQTHFCGE